MESKVSLGILGATGMAGREAVKHQKILEENGYGYASLELVTGGPSSQGRKLGKVFREKEEKLDRLYDFWTPQKCPEKFQELKVEGLDPEKISDKVDYVISALPSSVARDIEPELRDRGVHVFSNASEFRWKREVPLMIPEVNSETIKRLENQKSSGKQLNNPNCTTAGFAPVLEALRKDSNLESVDIVTFQSISGKGDKVASKDYSSRIKGNVIDDWDNKSNYNGEELKSELEPQKILGLASTKEEAKNTDLNIKVQTMRVPVQYGHLESVRIKFSNNVDEKEVRKIMKNWQPSEEVKNLPSTPNRPIEVHDRQPDPKKDVFNGEGMSVVVGDVRQLSSNRISLYSLSHNLRRGATWTARQSMELYLKRKGVI